MYMLGPNILKLMPSAYTVAQELERYKMGVLQVGIHLEVWWRAWRVRVRFSIACLPVPLNPAPPSFETT